VLVNNLPAATAQKPPHPLPLLIGLNLGPNLAFTGSLSAYLWYRTARAARVQPSLKQLSLLGLALVPLTLTAALLALGIRDPSAFKLVTQRRVGIGSAHQSTVDGQWSIPRR
jgi:Na+/H+ antiporter NhaD/arsenite permease-like protein